VAFAERILHKLVGRHVILDFVLVSQVESDGPVNLLQAQGSVGTWNLVMRLIAEMERLATVSR
jgi:hypothetical protein